jgi:MFS family permease
MSTHDPADNVIPIAARTLTRSAWNSLPRSVLSLLRLRYFIFYMDRVNISTAAPLIQKDLGLSNTALSFAFSAFAYPHALFQLIGGWLGDKFGPRLTLVVSGPVVCVSTALTGAVDGLTALVLVRLAPGFGEGAAFPTATRAQWRSGCRPLGGASRKASPISSPVWATH